MPMAPDPAPPAKSTWRAQPRVAWARRTMAVPLGLELVMANALAALGFAALILAATRLGAAEGWALAVFAVFFGLAITAMIRRGQAEARERARTTGELGKQNEIITLLLNGGNDSQGGWLWETAADGKLSYASENLAHLAGWSHAGIVGHDLAVLLPAGEEPAGWHDLQTALLRRKPIEAIEVNLPFPAADSWWRFIARPRLGQDTSFLGYQGAALDVTAARREHQKLAEAKAAAERQSASKSQFLAVMSHELRTPLNAIIGFAELLSGPGAAQAGEEQRAEHLRIILDSSKHLQTLINDVLDISRIEKGTMTIVEQDADAAELVEVSAKMCRSAAERADATVVANVSDGVALRCDITRLTQILTNLITNALKFSPAGGCVNVGFERQAGGGLAIYVRDAGLGIAREHLERIFEPYVQVDQGASRRFGGVGLGLAIARRIALLHGGNVTIESEPGVGTTARLVLPPSRVSWPADRAAPDSRAA